MRLAFLLLQKWPGTLVAGLSLKTQQKSNTKMPSAPLSLLKCLRNSLVHCHCGFKILYEADRRLGEEKEVKTKAGPI